MPAATRRSRSSVDIWPGFVDALSALLIIIIFLLMVFTLAQYFLSEALSGRDAALEQLRRTVLELKETLNLKEAENTELRGDLTRLTSALQASNAARDRMSTQLAELLPERDALAGTLKTRTEELATMTARAEALEQRNQQVARELEDAFKTIQADRETIEARLSEIASLTRDLDSLRKVRADLEKKVTELAQSLQLSKDELVDLTNRYKAGQLQIVSVTQKFEESQKELTAMSGKYRISQEALAKLKTDYAASQSALTAQRDRSKALDTRLSTEQERTALAQKEIKAQEIKIKEALAKSSDLGEKLTKEQIFSDAARKHVALLNQQIAALRRQLQKIEAALQLSETKSKEQNVQIVDLGRRLNLALASKVQELARYRSEFFGKLREVLGNRSDIRIVGDRFVFQSEVLFSSGSADLSPEGQRQIARLTRTLLSISKTIPNTLNWVLRVDGHTDKVPIATARFPSNWELSAERAISVVKYIRRLGVPPNRLVAAGFGEYHPIDAREDEIGFRRNRRIEFKLTER